MTYSIITYVLIIIVIVLSIKIWLSLLDKYGKEDFINTNEQLVLGSNIGNNSVEFDINRQDITDNYSFIGNDITEKIQHEEISHDTDNFKPEILIWNTIGKPKPAEEKIEFSRKDITKHQNEVFGFINKINHNTANEGADCIDKINEHVTVQGNESGYGKGKTISSIYDQLTKKY